MKWLEHSCIINCLGINEIFQDPIVLKKQSMFNNMITVDTV